MPAPMTMTDAGESLRTLAGRIFFRPFAGMTRIRFEGSPQHQRSLSPWPGLPSERR
jgi:hypothetical protein